MDKKEKEKKAVPDGALRLMMNTLATQRSELLRLMTGDNRDINYECHYPDNITPKDYHSMYDRDGVSGRVVDVMPEECWSIQPEIYEDEKPDQETEFEKEWTELNKNHNVLSFMERIDKLAGVGRFGILLIGTDDGKTLNTPIEKSTNKKAKRKLLYLRTFDESVVTVASCEADESSPRFSLPVLYNIQFQDEKGKTFTKSVHYTRVVHIADNREMSEIYGTPRMKKNYNRLLDIKKILSGSAEMFWKGAFPGYSFETKDDDTGSIELDADSLKEQMDDYMNGLQRYLALTGVTAKSLAPQVADPKGHLDAQINAIAISLGIPRRVLEGSERGELASSQDSKTWNRRLMKRQNSYITPFVIRPVIDRLIDMGILPAVEEYFVKWPDLDTQSDEERADNAKKWAEALSKYVAGDVDQMVPPEEFLGIFAGLDVDQIKTVMDALNKYMLENPIDDEEGMDNEPIGEE